MIAERHNISPADLKAAEAALQINASIQRYAAIRRFCWGRVLDIGCGTGYGSALIASNPDVQHVTGIDQTVSPHWKRYTSPSISLCLHRARVPAHGWSLGAHNVVVALEVIEHLDVPQSLSDIAHATMADQVIVSFPDKKSTHFNPYHKHDFVRQDIVDLFSDYAPIHAFRIGDVQLLVFVRVASPSHVFRNILDL